ncbi:MAG: hypothetical protein WA741_28780 [Candidatus Sulfotelmatobacter sp.]
MALDDAPSVLVGYCLRWNFRRAWYILRTGDEKPDWEKMGADYFIAPWERKRFEEKKAAKAAAPDAVGE